MSDQDTRQEQNNRWVDAAAALALATIALIALIYWASSQV